MSKNAWFIRIKRFYEKRLWTLTQVKEGVRVGVIDEVEYEEITGVEYAA